MSRIDGLTVQGVRSFTPNHRENLTLYTPLTLIVGTNGSGKTTIIECLKYATTGELPPNTKNGAFIHDPKLSNEKLVLANVGLKFTSIDGKSCVLHRKMQVTVAKSGKVTFKTLDSSYKEAGIDPRSGSNKVSELDEIVSDRLGVSPAILDSVIFCHQDESLWPMSEPSALKKKFDEIFEAQKFTKVIEQLKLIRKRRGEILRISQIRLKADESGRNVAKDESKAIHELKNQLEQMNQEGEELKERIQTVEDNSKLKREEANKFLAMDNELRNFQQQLDMKNDSVESLRDTIVMLNESDDELARMHQQFDARLEQLQRLIEDNESQHEGIEKQSKDLHAKVNAKLAEKGKLESDKEKYELQLQKRVEMIQQAATKHGIPGFSNDLDEDQVQAFNEKIQAMFNAKKKEHERLEKELGKAADEARNKISGLETKEISLSAARTSAKNKRIENDRRIKGLQTEADAIHCNEGQINILETQKAALEGSLQTTQEEFDQNDWSGKIHMAKAELGELENKSTELNAELVASNRLSSKRAELDIRKKELKDGERDLESLKGTYSGRISKILRCDFNIESVGSDFKSVHEEQRQFVKNEQSRCAELSKDLNQRDFEVAEARKRQTAALEAKTKYEQTVLKALKKVVDADAVDSVTVDDFEAQYDEIEDTKNVTEKDLHTFDQHKAFFETARTVMLTKNKCSMCDRRFENEQAKSKLIKSISKYVDLEEKAAIEAEFHLIDGKFNRLAAVRADFDAITRVTDDISKMTKEVDGAVLKREAQLEKLEAAEKKRAKAEEMLDEVESVLKPVSEITQLRMTVQELKAETDKLQAQSQLSGSGRSTDEIEEAQMVNAEQVKEVKRKLDFLTREKGVILSRISELTLELANTRHKLAVAKQQMTNKTSKLKEIKTIKEDNQAQEEEVSSIDQELKSLKPLIVSAKGQRDVEQNRGREKAQQVAKERDMVANTINTLKLVTSDIREYEDNGRASALAFCERAIKSLQQQHDQLKNEMAEVQERINSQTKELGEGGHRKRNIADNLRFRKDTRDLDQLGDKIAELKTHNAREDYEACMAEVHELDDERTTLLASKNTLGGKMNANDDVLKQKMKNWDKIYSGAEKTYKTTKIQVETVKGAIEDVATTSNVIDKAIMQFHSLKMEEINRIANELWRATYKGTDIDTIAIRSENETPSATSTSKRKNYNYRVTMVKSDTEMDMRGRCSAGQKVLASIIIRLALAESFGINCGLIALDEPTTNLDSENIKSLATSLHGIIKARQAQANFQLIVITHDEEFLRYMRCNEFCDFFYRVARDKDQNSTIKKDNIARITE